MTYCLRRAAPLEERIGHAQTLIAMGGAFLAAAVLARIGGRIGLPTIPLFILAGILLGPNTPGIVLVADPHDLEMLSRSAWCCCSSTSGSNSMWTTSKRAAGGWHWPVPPI